MEKVWEETAFRDKDREKLLALYFQGVGVAQLRDVTKLFEWRKPDAQKTLHALVAAGELAASITVEKQSGDWYAHQTLIS